MSPTFNEAPFLLTSGSGTRLQQGSIWGRALGVSRVGSNVDARGRWFFVVVAVVVLLDIEVELWRSDRLKGQENTF